MTSSILTALGGLGLFLLGMTVMTEALRELAGDTLRQGLARFTKNPVSGVATGTISTALVHSSSATTVMAVGFVGAGLLTFPEALGIIFGANIGTTITGWLVALLGFKLSLTDLVTPLKPLEAMAQDKIVAASAVGGHRELIRDGKTGVLFTPDDPHACAVALAGLLNRRSQWPTFILAGRKHVETAHDWATNVQRYQVVYQNLLTPQVQRVRKSLVHA